MKKKILSILMMMVTLLCGFIAGGEEDQRVAKIIFLPENSSAECQINCRNIDGMAIETIQSDVKIEAGEKEIRFTFVNYENEMSELPPGTVFHRHDGPVFGNESIEIYWQNSVDFRQFAMDWHNQRFDALGNDTFGFRPNWESTVSRSADGWNSQLIFPFPALGFEKYPSGEMIRLGLFRNRNGEFYAWSPTYGVYKRPEFWGYLVFGNAKETLLGRIEKAGAIAKISEIQSTIEGRSEEECRHDFLTLLAQINQCCQQDATAKFLEKYQAKGQQVVVQQTSPYHSTAPKCHYPEEEADYNWHFVTNEWNDFCWDITNLSTQPVTVRMSLRYGNTAGTDGKSPEQKGETLTAEPAYSDFLRLGIPGYDCEFFQPFPVATSDGQVAWDYLQPLSAGIVRIQPGETASLLLSLKPRPDAAAEIAGTIVFQVIDGIREPQQVYPLRLNAIPWDLESTKREYLTHGWDQLVPAIVQERPEFAAAHYKMLRKYGFNTAQICGVTHLPRPVVDAKGDLPTDLDFSHLHKILNLTEAAGFEYYYLHLTLFDKGEAYPDIFGIDIERPEYETVFKQYFQRCMKEFKDHGIDATRILINVYDESTGAEALKLAKWVKECGTEYQIIMNALESSSEELSAILPFTDVWMPHVNTIADPENREKFNYLKASGKKMMTYSYCAGAHEKLKDPFLEYLLPFWQYHAEGLTGRGYWAAGQYYGDPCYRANYHRYDTSLLYCHENGVTPSRRLLGWRRGEQDARMARAAEMVLPELNASSQNNIESLLYELRALCRKKLEER